ncbi:MAG: hypothetical protein ACOX3G_09280 [Armatimonadota bacterium]|jgi:hypothetical protein
MKIRLILTFTLALMTIAGLVQARQSRVVMVIAGSTSIRNFAQAGLPVFDDLFETGSAGLLNVRVGRASRDSLPASKSGFEAGCLSLGAGAMAAGGGEVRLAGDSTAQINDENIGNLFQYRTGIQPDTGEVLHSEIARIQRINEAASYRARPGALGSTLRNAGIKTAVIGNSDIPGEMHREGVAVAMDERGIVNEGEVDSAKLNEHNPASPFGTRVNINALLREYNNLHEDVRFVVIDFGDTFRADLYSDFCTDVLAAKHIRKAALRLNDFLGHLNGSLDPKTDLLIVLSPNPRSLSDLAGEKLGVIVVRGPGYERGMLTSASTRRQGVVTISDVAPTVLKFFDIKPAVDMVGRPINSVSGTNAAHSLLELNTKASAQAERQAIMRGTSIAQSVVVVLVLFAIFAISSPVVKNMGAWLLLCFPALSLAMFTMPLFFDGGVTVSVVVMVGLTVILSVMSALIFKTPVRSFVWLSAILVVGMMADLALGASLMARSIASYNIVEGARYYGIGNELMGTMLGASIAGVGLALAAGRLSRRMSGIVACVVFCCVFIFIAAPTLGANAGGALSTALAVVTVLLARRGRRPDWRSLSIIAIIAIAILIAVVAADMLRIGGSQSHIGRSMRMLAGGNATTIFDIIQRKIALNWMLVSTSLWSRLLGISVAGSIALYWWGRRIRGAQFLQIEESAAALGCCVGTAAAFVLNDSGVVAGATSSVFLFSLLALKLLEKPLKTAQN